MGVHVFPLPCPDDRREYGRPDPYAHERERERERDYDRRIDDRRYDECARPLLCVSPFPRFARRSRVCTFAPRPLTLFIAATTAVIVAVHRQHGTTTVVTMSARFEPTPTPTLNP